MDCWQMHYGISMRLGVHLLNPGLSLQLHCKAMQMVCGLLHYVNSSSAYCLRYSVHGERWAQHQRFTGKYLRYCQATVVGKLVSCGSICKGR